MTNLINKFKRDIAGILWLASAIFIAMALGSFHPTDPSFNSVSIGAGHKVLNLCGYFGSFLSDVLYQALGVAAWVVVLGALRLSISSFRGRTPSSGKTQRLISATLLILILGVPIAYNTLI